MYFIHNANVSYTVKFSTFFYFNVAVGKFSYIIFLVQPHFQALDFLQFNTKKKNL